jgi:hypothetical protein
MEIKLKTAKGPKLVYKSGSTPQLLAKPQLVPEEAPHIIEQTDHREADHGLDEKNLLAIFSTLLENLFNFDGKSTEMPQIGLIIGVYSLLEARCIPHAIILAKSQVGGP